VAHPHLLLWPEITRAAIVLGSRAVWASYDLTQTHDYGRHRRERGKGKGIVGVIVCGGRDGTWLARFLNF